MGREEEGREKGEGNGEKRVGRENRAVREKRGRWRNGG